ncbi:uncharacterized protein PAN0_002c1290 [Moesziomyces antarcticus]|uniref:Uncharacterized protein n=1 Tax=Pseudozyma antarctica TaxID=84753 RepID=A0A5C3FGE6_PSEA2|nr:uncharacterized protein PAN0_002c1290 [Moesziomyces antarcticus]GAK63088.1 conserved hypothetical protein [Moesziomyces antarcticus]SPO43428.1 uncharacterized protein PSANT_01113 [Moesziomyces antarcticus]
MPRPKTSATHSGSRDGSGEESDATLDPHSSSSAPSRRTRKRPAHMARQGSVEQTSSPASRSYAGSQNASNVADLSDVGEGNSQARSRYTDRRSSGQPHRTVTSAFESPDQARERLVLMQSSSPRVSNTQSAHDHTHPARSNTNTPDARSRLDTAHGAQTPHASSSRCIETSITSMSQTRMNGSASNRMQVAEASARLEPATTGLSLHLPPYEAGSYAEMEPARSGPLQPLSSSTQLSAPSMASTASNMSPPRPTRALPRRRASARTQSRPLLSSSNSASSSYALRSRSSSSSNVLASSSSAANIMASGQNRLNLATGCAPLGGGFDPSYTPPSGMSTPRTPLAEIPLWLADMRSQSRRSSTSSTSFIDRDDYLTASRSAASHHARTLSASSSGPSSPGATRTGSISPVVPFRRSLRGRRPRQSDENARLSPSPSYFGEFENGSAASTRGEMTALDETPDADDSTSSSMIHLGTTSPSTPSVQLQASSPAMSTRSRTLNRLASIRARRLTDPLNAPITTSAPPASERQDARYAQRIALSSSYGQLRSTVADEQRSASLLERRFAAANVSASPSGPTGRVSSRPSSRTSSPARGTRASRRRSTAAEGQVGSAVDANHLGPVPADLPPLQIHTARLHRDAAHEVPYPAAIPGLHDAAGSSRLSGLEGATAAGLEGPAMQLEPISPSAFSEMTSLTQGSTASESVNSVGGMPTTPSSSASLLDPFSRSLGHDAGFGEATASSSRARGEASVRTDETVDAGANSAAASQRSDRMLRQQRKNPMAARSGEEDALGLRLDPRP